MITPPSTCPDCGHNRLTHRRGVCMAIISVNGSRVKGHCACTAILQPNVDGAQLALSGPEWNEAVQWATNERIVRERQ